MVSQKSWRHLTKKPISFKEYLRIITNLKTIPDQAVALVCGAMVERGLERAIASRLKKLEKGHYHGIFDGGGMLSGFMARMKMGYALSLFGAETYNDLDNVREIRNAFAHAIHPVTFETKRIAISCNKLKTSFKKLPPFLFEEPPKTARDRYICTAVLFWFMFYAADTDRPKRVRDGWSQMYLR